MGVVYKARHRSLGRLVALKMICGGAPTRPEQVARFKTEAEAVARLRHANIVQIYDIGECRGEPFVSFELLEGGSLADRLVQTPQPGRAAAGLMMTLASAMEAAHSAGIVHRDLKPSNILFDQEGSPKITDFGLAKRLEADEGQTVTGQVMGTPSYMAPEQARGRTREITPATDVYALGAILYEMLTGRPPFKGPSTMETVRQVIENDPVPPSRLQPRVPLDLETVCLKCLAKEPTKRYNSARDLADDLRRYLGGEPIRARRTPPQERAAKWARRHPTAASLVALAAASLVAIAFAASHYNSASVQRELRETARVAGVRSRADRAIFDGQRFLAEKNWPEARLLLSNVLTRIKEESRLGAERARAAELLAQADRGSAEQGEREAERRRFEEFLRSRDEALFYETQFTGLDLPGNLEKSRSSARAALGIFADKVSAGGGWMLGPLPGSLSEAERSAVRERCYELLLILAEAEDRPDDGLAMLDAAARLDPTPNQA